MRKIILLVCLMFVLVSCGSSELGGKFDDLSESEKKEVTNEYHTQVTLFKSNEAQEMMTKIMTTKMTEENMSKEMDRIETETINRFNNFKSKYKNIDFSGSSFSGICSDILTKGTCFE